MTPTSLWISRPESTHVAQVRRWNATTRPWPREVGLAELFGRWARETPDACAVIDGGHRLSYRELERRANAVAHALVGEDVQTGQRVGVLGTRCADAVVALVGIIKAGAVYVPLDTGYPAPRLTAMVEDADVHAVIALPGSDCDLDVGTVLRVQEQTMDHPPALARSITGEDLAYVMFTSGSTGHPKAVGIRQRGITRLVVNTDYITFGPDIRVLHASSLSFDASTFEIWGALLNGACLVVADSHLLVSPEDLRSLFQTQGITTAFITTAVFHRLAQQTPDIFGTLRDVLVGGEALNPASAQSVLANGRPPRHLINVYGPTENTAFTTTYLVNDLPADATVMPIGRPIANTTCYILRDDGTMADVGQKGELCAGGDGVAVGYLNNPELTADRFIPDPFSDDPAARLYRTGDLVSWRADGTLDYHGRRDTQYKIHGYRIEAGEIEAALLRHPFITDAVVIRREVTTVSGAKDAELLAYFATAGDLAPQTAELHDHLARQLPKHMLPAVFIPLPQMPLTANGKVDRAALPAVPAAAHLPNGTPVSPASPPLCDGTVQEQIRAIWGEVLRARGIEHDIEPEDTLFNIGGTSFDVLEIHGKAAALFNVPNLNPLDLFAHPTLRGYADHLASLINTAPTGKTASR
ncbi:non-ribosomal peptide synthetase [Streptomyces sp. NPDC056069]|uniref:non-ribosomal peptide synthetase n=1 Tax=Streptomyces sp. NPDC056069 TaxID=3345702 RepID=UPI0035DA5FF0